MQTIKAYYAIFVMQIKLSLERPTYRFILFVYPVVYLLIFYYININKTENLTIILMNSVIVTLWTTLCYSSLGDIQRERNMGTFEYIYCCPISFYTILLIKTLANTFLGSSSLIIVMVFANLFLKINIFIANILLFFPMLLMVIVSIVSFSLTIASAFTASRENLLWVNILIYPSYIICGMAVPITFFPKWVQNICNIFPPTRAISLLRSTIDGVTNMKVFFIELCYLILTNIVFFTLSIIILNTLDKKMRKDNTGGGI